MSSFGKFVLGAAVGGVVGGVIGLLLAPRPGHETRQMLADEMNRRVDDTKTAIKDGVDHSVNVAKERVNDAKERVNDTVDTVRNRAQELSDKAKQLGEEFEETGRRTLSAIGQSKPATKES